MRVLAYFSFAFAAGLLPELLRLPWWASLVCFLLLAAASVTGFALRGRRERAAAVCALGAACGVLWGFCYDRLFLAPAEASAEKNCTITMELCEYPSETRYGFQSVGRMEKDGVSFRVRVYFAQDSGAEGWKPGDVLTGVGTLSPADGNGEDGWYHRSIGIPMKVSNYQDISVEPAVRIPVRYLPEAFSHLLRRTAEVLFPEDVLGYVTALLTGDKSGLSYQQESDLQIAGVYHALAVSGMHVSILMSVLAVLTMKRQRLYLLIGVPVLIFYCVMIGGTGSVVRAAVMHGFLMAAPVFRRESDPPTALGASLLVLTVGNPWSLLHVGLQLSFLATAGILAFYGPMNAALCRRPIRKHRVLRRFRNTVASVTACTCSALALTAPVMTFQFGILSVLSILANLLVLQAITISFVLSFAACFGAVLSLGLGQALAFPVTWLLRYVAWCCRGLSRLPFAAVYVNNLFPVAWFVLVYGLLLLLLLRRQKKTLRELTLCAGCAVITLCAALLLSWADGSRGNLVFQVLDVGQGQCLLYRSGPYTAAVDCGGSHGDEAGETLARTLLSSGQTRLNYLVLTHYDDDHTGGVEQLLYRIPVDVILMPDVPDDSGVRTELEQLAATAGTGIRYVSQDMLLPLGNASMQVFAPLDDEGGNESSLCVLTSCEDFDILATGDLGTGNELELMTRYALPDVEVLVAGHHGAKSSTGTLLLGRLRPEMLVISVGENRYGHPAEEVLARAAAVGAEIYRTDLNGTITIRR